MGMAPPWSQADPVPVRPNSGVQNRIIHLHRKSMLVEREVAARLAEEIGLRRGRTHDPAGSETAMEIARFIRDDAFPEIRMVVDMHYPEVMWQLAALRGGRSRG
jgi:hypothetical protein